MDKIEEEVHESVRLVAPPSFESWINGFLAWVQLEKGLSANTITSYETDLTQCALFYMTARFLIGRMPSLMIILPGSLPLLIVNMRSPAQVRKLSALRMMIRYFVGEGELGENHTELLGTLKKEEPCLIV